MDSKPVIHVEGAKTIDKPFPVFIKVEKYKDIVKFLQDLRSYVLNLRDALDAMEDFQREIKKGFVMAQKTLDEINMVLSSLDSYFLKPETIDYIDTAVKEVKEKEVKKPEKKSVMKKEEMEKYVKGIYDQLEELKSQLQVISWDETNKNK
ncbi:MAG: hypothetical protein DRP03_01405 [Candidatus Aenigmatarchaeota archaeon]|nr:MAG: hypothetical protein DRP03_01405 [Candidatus Aenigmarchaeota archaeon]